MDFWRPNRVIQHNSALDSGVRDALADLCRQRWPSGAAKQAAREWDLSLDEARGVVAGRASLATYEKIIKSPRGFLVGLHVLESVTGESVAHFFSEQLRLAAKANQDAEQHEQLARAAYRRLSGRADPARDGRDTTPTAREAWSGARALGSEEARRLD